MYFWNDKINNNGMFDGQNWIIDLKCVQSRFYRENNNSGSWYSGSAGAARKTKSLMPFAERGIDLHIKEGTTS